MAQATTSSANFNTGLKRLTRTIKSSLRHEANFSNSSSLNNNNNSKQSATNSHNKSPKPGYSNKARAFLSRGAQAIVRMRGLPFSCSAQQVVEFFAGKCEILDGEEGILFVKNYDEKPTGDAFVLFASDELAQRALQKHRENIGARYVELFRSSISEVQQVLSISMDSALAAGSGAAQRPPHPLAGASKAPSPQPAGRARATGATYAQVATSRALEGAAGEAAPASRESSASELKRDQSDSSAFDSNSLNSSGSSGSAADLQAVAPAVAPAPAARSPLSSLSAGSSGCSSGGRSWPARNPRQVPAAQHYRAAQHHYHHAHPQHHYGAAHYGPPAPPFHYQRQQHQHYQQPYLAYQQAGYQSAPAAGPQPPAHVAYAPHPYHFYPQLPAHAQPPYQHEPNAASKRDCVRLRGLPFEAQIEDVLYFLADHSKGIVYQGVHMVYSAQGQPSGEAIIQMNSCAAASMAAQEFHRKVMSVGKKQRYIEVSPCSIDDMNLMLGLGYLGHHSLLSAPHNTPLHHQLAATAYPPPAYPHHLPAYPQAAPDHKLRHRPLGASDAMLSPVDAPASAAAAASPDSPQEKPEAPIANHKMMAVTPNNMMQPPATYYPVLYYYPQQMLAAPYH